MNNYQSVLVIYNPGAKRGKIDEVLPYIKQRLSLRFSTVDITTGKSSKDAEDLAYKNAGKYDIIVSCGGDGTLHQVANGILKSEFNPLLGVLPFGTCNDVARTLGISNNLDLALDCLLRLNVAKYDVVSDGSDYMIYSLACGYLTNTSYEASSKAKKFFGKMAYVFKALKNIFKFKPFPMTFSTDNERIHGKFVFVMMLNGESAGGFKLNKDEDLNNNKVKLILIKKSKILGSFITMIRLFMFGAKKIMKSKNAIVRDVNSVEIENHSNVPFTFDGEKFKFLRKKFKVSKTLTFIKK